MQHLLTTPSKAAELERLKFIRRVFQNLLIFFADYGHQHMLEPKCDHCNFMPIRSALLHYNFPTRAQHFESRHGHLHYSFTVSMMPVALNLLVISGFALNKWVESLQLE